jgi:hypothetical protein
MTEEEVSLLQQKARIEGRYRREGLDITAEPQRDGSWRIIPHVRPILPPHALDCHYAPWESKP